MNSDECIVTGDFCSLCVAKAGSRCWIDCITRMRADDVVHLMIQVQFIVNCYIHPLPAELVEVRRALISYMYLNAQNPQPTHPINAQPLESIQLFATRMAAKVWNGSADELNERFSLPSLSQKRNYFKLLFIYKFLHGFYFLPPNHLFFTPPPILDIIIVNLTIAFCQNCIIL